MNTTKRSSGTISLLALLLLTGCPNMTGAHKTTAEKEAHQYAREMGYDVAAVSCVRQDTDGDGYVSCTLKMADDTVVDLECAGAWTMNSGCRAAKIGVTLGQPRGGR